MEFTYKNDELLPISTKKPDFLKDNIKGEVFHGSFLDYLHHGYARHYGIVVKPDFIWFTILNEMNRIIKGDPEHYREIFTDSDAKKEVRVLTLDPIVMPIDSLLNKTFALIPDGLNKFDILLDFSTLSNSSKLAFSVSFLEAASPYYQYSMYKCGYNKINVLGEVGDYKLMKSAINSLSEVFAGKKIIKYFDKVQTLLDNIIDNFGNAGFWENIFFVEKCRSGSQKSVMGWFKDFFDEFSGLKLITAYPKHVAAIEYKNLSTGLSYQMKVGLFSSIIEDGYLVPDFEFGINEISEDKL